MRVLQVGHEPFLDGGVDLGQVAGINFVHRPITSPPFLCLEGNPGPLGQSLDRLRKRQVLPQLDKLEDIPPGPAGETLENLLGRADIHTRTVVRMKRTQSHEIPALPLKGEMLGDHFNNIAGLLNSADQILIKLT